MEPLCTDYEYPETLPLMGCSRREVIEDTETPLGKRLGSAQRGVLNESGWSRGSREIVPQLRPLGLYLHPRPSAQQLSV